MGVVNSSRTVVFFGHRYSHSLFSKERCNPLKLLNRQTATKSVSACCELSPQRLASRSKASLGMVVSMLALWLPTDRTLYRLIMTLSSLSVIVWFSMFFTFSC